ncbi:MAG TPA: hypothetical protein VHR42_05915 [Clostridia bacterium]|nr:hypothetical protein [Clostridia bacterium]
MKKTGHLFIIGIIIIAILVLAVFTGYKSMKPSVSEKDIAVEAVLGSNNTGVTNDKEYVLDISMTKNKDCHIIVYPYIEGLGGMAFNNVDDKVYYVPNNIGYDTLTEPVAVDELKKEGAVETGKDISLDGFWFPYNAGQYKTRVYLDGTDSFKENPVLVCVYTEKKLGKQFTWAKTVPINN